MISRLFSKEEENFILKNKELIDRSMDLGSILREILPSLLISKYDGKYTFSERFSLAWGILTNREITLDVHLKYTTTLILFNFRVDGITRLAFAVRSSSGPMLTILDSEIDSNNKALYSFVFDKLVKGGIPKSITKEFLSRISKITPKNS